MDSGQMGPTHQLLGTGMGGLLRDLLAFPAFLARYWRVDELCWSYYGRCDLYRVGRLVYAWTQAICAAAG